MRRSVVSDRLMLIAVVAAAAAAAQTGTAAAQACEVPPLKDDICKDADGSVDSYIDCYTKLFDQNIIPAFKAVAKCSYAKTDYGLSQALENLGSEVTGVVQGLADGLETRLNGPGMTPQHCIGDVNQVEETLRQYMDAERNAPDIDAYRRTHYTFSHLSFFTDVLLAARQNRAGCD